MLLPGTPPVDEVGSVPVDDGTEGQAIPPGAGEVGDTHPRVLVRSSFGPPKQVVFGGHVGLLANHYVRYLKRREIKVKTCARVVVRYLKIYPAYAF